MTPDVLFDYAVEHPDYDRWRAFYHDAWVHACDIAAGTPFDPEGVAFAIAALSPNKGWTQNLNLARSAVALACRATDPSDLSDVEEVMLPLGAMGSRKIAAAKALAWLEIPSGPKVSAFARNIAGDLRPVTVDRHMLDIFPGGDAADWCVMKAMTTGLWPAEVQAVLWGAHRNLKGYATY